MPRDSEAPPNPTPEPEAIKPAPDMVRAEVKPPVKPEAVGTAHIPTPEGKI